MELFTVIFIGLFVALIVGLSVTYLNKRKKKIKELKEKVDRSNYKRIPATASYNQTNTSNNTALDTVTNIALLDYLLDDDENESTKEVKADDYDTQPLTPSTPQLANTYEDSASKNWEVDTTPVNAPSDYNSSKVSFGSSSSSSKVSFDSDDRKYDSGSSHSSYSSSSSSSSDSSSSYDSGSSSSSSSWD